MYQIQLAATSSRSEGHRTTFARLSLHLLEAARCRSLLSARASIRLFFLGRCGDPQGAVRTRCIRNHFSNVLQRHETSRIRQRCQDLQADQVVDQFSDLAEALDLRYGKQTGQACYRHAVLLRGPSMHAADFSPLFISTVLGAVEKQMCSDGQLSAADLKFGGPFFSELVFDIADKRTEKWCEHFDEVTGAALPADLVKEASTRKSLGRKRSISPTRYPEPKRRREEYPLCRSDGSWWIRATQVEQTSDAGRLARN